MLWWSNSDLIQEVEVAFSRCRESEVIRQAELGEVVSCQRDAGRADLRGGSFQLAWHLIRVDLFGVRFRVSR